jgi:hypothetical protein
MRKKHEKTRKNAKQPIARLSGFLVMKKYYKIDVLILKGGYT